MADIKGPFNFRDSAHRRAMDVANLIEESTLPAAQQGQEPDGIDIGCLWYDSSTHRLRLRTPSGDIDPGSADGGDPSGNLPVVLVSENGNIAPNAVYFIVSSAVTELAITPGALNQTIRIRFFNTGTLTLSSASALVEPPNGQTSGSATFEYTELDVYEWTLVEAGGQPVWIVTDRFGPATHLAVSDEGDPYFSSVKVGGSAPPEEGDILTAIGSDTASWQTPKPAKALHRGGDSFDSGVVLEPASPTAGHVLTALTVDSAGWRAPAAGSSNVVGKVQTAQVTATHPTRADIPGLTWTGLTPGRYVLETTFLASRGANATTLLRTALRWITGGTQADLGDQWYFDYGGSNTMKYAPTGSSFSAEGFTFTSSGSQVIVHYQTIINVTAASASCAVTVGGASGSTTGDNVTISEGVGWLTKLS